MFTRLFNIFARKVLYSDRQKETEHEKKPGTQTILSKNINKNTSLVKNMLKDCNDVIFRDISIGGPGGKKAFLFYIEGMVNTGHINEFIVEPLMIGFAKIDTGLSNIKIKLLGTVKKTAVPVSGIKETEYVEDSLFSMLEGNTILIIDGYDKALIIGLKYFPARSIAEPSTETVVRGPKDSFNEVITTNIALVRRRIRDIGLKIVKRQVGLRSKTDIAVMYIKDIADPRIIDEVNKRLDKINIDAVLDSGYIQQIIENGQFSLFPQLQATERPDVVAGALYEGRVGIFVDNSPYVLLVPVTLTAFFQSAEDYYLKSAIVTFVRLIRILAGIFALLTPAAYIALTAFHPGIIPTSLALSIAGTREGVPFPSVIEALFMIMTLEILREAGVRLPRPLGSTISIVGGLVIGQAAVAAGIVSPIMVIVVSLTAIATFAIPNYELAAAMGIIRIALIFAANIYGLFGIILGIIALTIYMVNIKSFGTPFLSPLAPFHLSEMKDSIFLRAPWKYLTKRPEHLDPLDSERGGERQDGSK